ncbi:hypothetical protein AAF712_013383 [Marasmius tenuissimus]|uniref:Ribosomal RNA methyltransferase FtsJ domain-containing protein n=1 Tax=Marasmius tenuissimus TaxID=585030 RepID=A0ABR2ZES6_9AGAR|nr:hypothetical protein PM082_011470 [Marasmius tenuissimus]
MNALLPSLKSKELKDLHRLRSSKHGPMLDAHFAHQKRQADSQGPEVQKAWFNAMKKVFEEIDEMLVVLSPAAPFSFLDVGCCPGGFSSYILSTYPHARGSGVSLPVDKGGHALLLEEALQPRFDLIWADITLFQLGNTLTLNPSFTPFPFSPEHPGYDLIILDGHPLRTAGPDVHALGDKLLISSLILGLWCINRGGTIIMKLSMPDRKITAQILYMFDVLSGDLRTWKPVHIHATRSTFYAIARNFGCGGHAPRYNEIFERLRHLWEALVGADVLGNGRGRRLLPSDLDFIVDDAGLKDYSKRLKALSKHLWMVERESLAQWHEARRNGL